MLEGAQCVQGLEYKTQKDFDVRALSVTLQQIRKAKNCMMKSVTSEG